MTAPCTDPYAVALARAFAARRCPCGRAAVAVAPGREAVRVAGVLIERARPDRNRCLRHVNAWRKGAAA